RSPIWMVMSGRGLGAGRRRTWWHVAACSGPEADPDPARAMRRRESVAPPLRGTRRPGRQRMGRRSCGASPWLPHRGWKRHGPEDPGAGPSGLRAQAGSWPWRSGQTTWKPAKGLENNAFGPIQEGAAAWCRRPRLQEAHMSIVRHRQRPTELALHDEIKQVFDRFFGETDTDASAVVTAQWVPRVDIKEEAERFVIYADLPGIDPQ